jgi:hypothetical protein
MTQMLEKKDPSVMSIGGEKIQRGQRQRVYLKSAALYD